MKKMKRAFTLVELMAVVTIMTLLGFAAVGGYSAMQRGMRERGAVASASAILRAAKERAAVDRVPTAVYCYNVMLRASDADADENAVYVGVMTAVRRAGRLSMVSGELLYDEFGDLNAAYPCLSKTADLCRPVTGQTYTQNDLAKRPGMRLFKFPTTDSDTYSTAGTMEYSIVADAVWCSKENYVFLFSGTVSGGETNCLMSAFYDKGGSQYSPKGGWKVGDAYAFPIGEIQLPLNMTFDQNVPSSVSKISTPKVIVFDPTQEDAKGEVDVYTVLPGANGKPRYQKAGTATSDEKKKM